MNDPDPRTLVRAREGDLGAFEDLVRQYRLAFQEAVEATATGAVEELTGRKVIGYHSQIVFDPPRAFEIFALDTKLDVPAAADAFETRVNVMKAMQGHILGKAVYMGLFRRPQ